jgi:hypothetical protein
VVLLDSPCVAQYLRKVEASSNAVVLVLAQCFCVGLPRWVPPERVGRDDGVGRLLVNGVAKRKRQAAFGHIYVIRSDIFQAFSVTTKPDAPLGLDGARGSVVEFVNDRLALSGGNLKECLIQGRSRSRIPVPIERHVGQTSVRSEGRRLPFCAFEGRHVDRRNRLRHFGILMRDVFDEVHGLLPALQTPSSHTVRVLPRSRISWSSALQTVSWSA